MWRFRSMDKSWRMTLNVACHTVAYSHIWKLLNLK